MGQVTIRTGQTSRGCFAISPWNGYSNSYTISTISLGDNPISRIEVVSALNSFNFAPWQYHFNQGNCTPKYNPKVYLGAIQTSCVNWLYDDFTGQINGLPILPDRTEKSGSCLFYSICLSTNFSASYTNI